ncbi:hypothetical protein ACP275_02G088600 [Erythranthe tilingii]
MVKNNLPILLVSFFLAIALCSCNKNPALRNKGIQYWCVADTGADPLALQKFLDNGCNQFDCSPILPGGACFGPDGILGHSSWLLDKFYKEFGVCEKGLGFITTTDPSYDDCHYP